MKQASSAGTGCVVVDDHPSHKSKLARELVDRQAGKLPLLFLPRYSALVRSLLGHHERWYARM